MQKWRGLLGMGALIGVTAGGGTSACRSETDCAATGLCASPPADGDGGAGGGPDGEVPDAAKPADCDDKADPASDAAKGCVVDSFALFVDGDAGDDANDGSKAKPFKRIATAIAKVGSTGKRRIYVCGSGTYAEHLKITTAANLHGGFACSTWAVDTAAKPKVAPSDPGYALHIDDVSAAVTISDLELLAADAGSREDGTSSIAVFANKANVTFLRAALRASNGAQGAPGARGEKGVVTSAGGLDGNPANGAMGGALKECTCSSSTTVTRGGVGGSTGSGGGNGEPNYGAPPPQNGAAGLPGGGSCSGDSLGKNGADAPPAADADPVTTLGTLSADGWVPTKGADGPENGKPGQGGGGGGARDSAIGGSGGGCGGCGGFAGKGSGGGGASIALLAHESSVTLTASRLEAKSAGAGGTAGAGGQGEPGGGAGITGLCSGGNGGRGADGGAGSGGAGGVSAGILYKGTEPTLDAETTIVTGKEGAGGKGGKSPDNDGPNGVAGKTLDVAKL